MVRLGPGDDVPARLVGADPKSDLAVLQVKADLKVQAEWGDSDKLDIGDWVLAIGSPLGFDHSVTAGIVSATERNDVRITRIRVVHPDRRGDQSGELGRAADRPGRQGRGHQHGDHHPVRRLRGDRPGDPLVAGAPGRREPDQGGEGRPRLPRRHLIHGRSTTTLARKLKLPEQPRGAGRGSPAGQPGGAGRAEVDDVIVKLADRDVADPAGLRNLTAGLDVGSQVPSPSIATAKPRRPGDARRASRRPGSAVVVGLRRPRAPRGQRRRRNRLEIDQVVAGSPAFQAGLRPGMRILAVGENPEPVTTLAEFEAAVRKLDLSRGLPLVVQTHRWPRSGRSAWDRRQRTAMTESLDAASSPGRPVRLNVSARPEPIESASALRSLPSVHRFAARCRDATTAFHVRIHDVSDNIRSRAGT